MDFFAEAFSEAFTLLVGGDRETWEAIALSAWTSVLAVAIGALVGVPVGAWVGLFRPRGSRFYAALLRVLAATPTVVIGLFLFGLLSRRGPLAGLNLLYTPAAIVIGQALLAAPIVATLTHGATAGLDRAVLETVRTHGGGRLLAMRLAIGELRPALVAALLLAYGRCVTELGIVLIVGGGILHLTRTLPAQATFEVSRGDYSRAVAAGLVLELLIVVVVLATPIVAREEKR